MDSYFCRNCEKFQCRILENTCRGGRKQPPFRAVFIQMLCGTKILATERVGYAERVDEDYALLCQPNATYTGIISKDFLSEQMLEDYDSAERRAFKRIDGYLECEMPSRCEYRFEQELSNLNN